MRVAALVDRHVVDGGAQVGAVIEVETAQEKLVGLALATVLGGDQPGRRFEQLARAVHGAHLQLLLIDAAGIGRIGNAQLAGARAVDQHALQYQVVGARGQVAQRQGHGERG